MDLFTPVVPPERFHKNFASVLAPFRKAERDLLEVWSQGFVDRDGKLVEEFQTTFNSAFWELYLHAAFKEYGFNVDWTHTAPDFLLRNGQAEVVVEAATANAAVGKPNEWDRTFSEEELKALTPLKKLNTEAMVRLSNALFGKTRKYEQSYSRLDHVKGRPFVVAIAPFEQPHFNHQHDRPIRALLYDHYVDEDEYLAHPDLYPDGPPSVSLGFIRKDNGAELSLGVFNNPGMPEVSAVLFSCLATWGKLSAMSNNVETKAEITSIWATPPTGKPELRRTTRKEHAESVRDGLQIYHNPYARSPVPPDFFRGPRVVQHYVDHDAREWRYEGHTDALLFRRVFAEPVSTSGSALARASDK